MKWIATIILVSSSIAVAQSNANKQKRVGLDTSSNIRINYGRAAWNKNPTAIDSASILMREGSTGRTIQISLTETAPDSATFSGLYQISFQNMQRLQTEFYIPDQAELEKKDGLKKLLARISRGELVRNPFILRRQPTGEQSVEIFDTKEQAREALKAYKAEQTLAVKATGPVKIPSDQAIETAELAAKLKQQAEEAAALADRQRLAQIEAKRMADLQAAQAAMAEQERAKRKQQAQALAAEGLELFKKEDFAGAKDKFDQAMQLDPANQQFYLQFGITLFRLEDFNRSLVVLKLATAPEVSAKERDFYIGLNQFRMKEYASALGSFDSVSKAGDKSLSPSAEFYEGVIHFEQRTWDQARASFQTVLDTSSDPKLDERAEAYIEQIMRVQQYEEEAKKKWFLSATIGEQYDSNVLLVADSSTSGTATNTEGIRSLVSGSVKYRPLFEETREFAAQLDVTTMYTTTTSFQGDQNLRNADPTVATLNLPYTIKGLMFGKGMKFDIGPGYETIYMSIENNETKEIQSALSLTSSGLLVMSETWFSTYGLDIRQETSKLSSSTGDDDASSVKVKLSTNQTFLVGEDKKQFLIPDAAYTINAAAGKNAVYTRLDLGTSYVMPWKWETSASFKLAYYALNYPQNSSGRADSNYTVTAGLSRKITDIWSTGLLTSYSSNQSNSSSNTYNKFTALLTFSAQYGF